MPTNRDVDKFIERISELIGIGEQEIDYDNADYLWRIINGGGVVIPSNIVPQVFRFRRHGYATRNHTPSLIFEEAMNFFSSPKHSILYDRGLILFLQEREVRAYLTQDQAEFSQTL